MTIYCTGTTYNQFGKKIISIVCIPHVRINFKQVRNLSVKPETLQILEHSMEKFHFNYRGKGFLMLTTNPETIKEKTDKLMNLTT